MKLTKLAQEIIDKVNNGEDINDITQDIELPWMCSDGFEYGIYDGGYIKPEDILEGEDLVKVNEAIAIVGEFRDIYNQINPEF